eukprot:9792575-Lingulodinium_polyedra.AAC.1
MPTLGAVFGGDAAAVIGGDPPDWVQPAADRLERAKRCCDALQAIARANLHPLARHLVWKVLAASVARRLDYDIRLCPFGALCP